jgi:hypothetical protein
LAAELIISDVAAACERALNGALAAENTSVVR